MEEEQEQPEKKKPSLLRPLLLWPMIGVPMFWGLQQFLFWYFTKDHPTHDIGPEIFSGLYALILSTVICFGIGAWLGVRFARQAGGAKHPLAEAVLNGLSAAALSLAYNFGGCALVGGIGGIFSH